MNPINLFLRISIFLAVVAFSVVSLLEDPQQPDPEVTQPIAPPIGEWLLRGNPDTLTYILYIDQGSTNGRDPGYTMVIDSGQGKPLGSESLYYLSDYYCEYTKTGHSPRYRIDGEGYLIFHNKNGNHFRVAPVEEEVR